MYGTMLHFSPDSAAAPPPPYPSYYRMPPPPCGRRHQSPPPDDGDFLLRFQTDFSADAPRMGNLMCTASVSEYDLGGEGDLFKAPEPIIEEPELAIDPMAAAMSVMSAGDDVMSETVNIAAMESIEEDSLLSDVFYQFEKDFLAKSAIEEPLFELSDLKVPPLRTEEVPLGEENIFNEEGSIQRSISAGCLISPDWVNGCIARPNFLGFQGLDFEAAFGIRRAFSEGDIKELCHFHGDLISGLNGGCGCDQPTA